MTPHYSEYYINKNGNNPPPADYYDPKLIKFATVEDTKFRFPFVIKSKKVNNDLLKKMIRKLLEEYGLGAKTAVGYGYFKNIDNITDKIIKNVKRIRLKEKMKDMSEEEKDLLELKNASSKDKIHRIASKYFKKLDQLSTDKAKEIAKLLKTKYDSIGKWKNPSNQSKKQKRKIKKIKKILGG